MWTSPPASNGFVPARCGVAAIGQSAWPISAQAFSRFPFSLHVSRSLFWPSRVSPAPPSLVFVIAAVELFTKHGQAQELLASLVRVNRAMYTFSAFELRSCVVFVLIIVTADISSPGDLRVTYIFQGGIVCYELALALARVFRHGTLPCAAQLLGD